MKSAGINVGIGVLIGIAVTIGAMKLLGYRDDQHPAGTIEDLSVDEFGRCKFVCAITPGQEPVFTTATIGPSPPKIQFPDNYIDDTHLGAGNSWWLTK